MKKGKSGEAAASGVNDPVGGWGGGAACGSTLKCVSISKFLPKGKNLAPPLLLGS